MAGGGIKIYYLKRKWSRLLNWTYRLRAWDDSMLVGKYAEFFVLKKGGRKGQYPKVIARSQEKIFRGNFGGNRILKKVHILDYIEKKTLIK